MRKYQDDERKLQNQEEIRRVQTEIIELEKRVLKLEKLCARLTSELNISESRRIEMQEVIESLQDTIDRLLLL